MKIIITSALALVLALSLAACGGNNTTSPSGNLVSNLPFDTGSSQTESTVGGASDNGTEWPETWPGDILQINGTVYLISDDGIDTPTGITVYLYVENVDIVKLYIEKLETQGIKKTGGTGDFDIGSVSWTLENDDYVMHINYKEKDQKCSVDISTSDDYRIAQ